MRVWALWDGPLPFAVPAGTTWIRLSMTGEQWRKVDGRWWYRQLPR